MGMMHSELPGYLLEYNTVINPAVKRDSGKFIKVLAPIFAFSPVLWILIFSALTVLINVLGGIIK